MRCIRCWKVFQACQWGRNLGDVARFDQMLTTGQWLSWENSPKLSRYSSFVSHAWWTLNSQRKGCVRFLWNVHIQLIFHTILVMKFLIAMTIWRSVCVPIKNCTVASSVVVWNVGVIEGALFMIGSLERNTTGVQYKEGETIVTMQKITCECLY